MTFQILVPRICFRYKKDDVAYLFQNFFGNGRPIFFLEMNVQKIFVQKILLEKCFGKHVYFLQIVFVSNNFLMLNVLKILMAIKLFTWIASK